MAVVNGYASRDDLKSWLEVPLDPDPELDPLVDDAITASSRGIDNACKRHFFTVTETRFFNAASYSLVRFGTWNDAASVTEVATDDDDDGTFMVWDADDFTLIPLNRQGAELLPVRGVVAIGDRSFPLGGKRPGRSRITAPWGWADVPVAIHEATILQSARLVKRRKSPEGVVGLNMFGSVKVGRLDPDVGKLIKRYRLRTVG